MCGQIFTLIIIPILVGGVFGWEHIFYLTINLKSMGGQIFTLIITPILVGGVFGWEIIIYLTIILKSMGGKYFQHLICERVKGNAIHSRFSYNPWPIFIRVYGIVAKLDPLSFDLEIQQLIQDTEDLLEFLPATYFQQVVFEFSLSHIGLYLTFSATMVLTFQIQSWEENNLRKV